MASCYPKSYKMEQYGSDIQERFSVASEESTPYVPLERSDFPAVFEALKSSEPDTWNESLNKLNLFLENQREFAIENPDVINLPVIFEVANTTDDETLRSSLLETMGTFTSLSSDTLPKVIPFIPKLVTLIALGNSADLYHILSILEEVTGQHPSTEEDILQELTTIYAPVASMNPEESDSSEARVVALIEAFENCLIFSRSTLVPIFTKANVVDAILASAFCKTAKIRAAAASCFAQMMEHLDTINSNLPDETNRGNLIVFIFSAFAQLISDKDEEIAKVAANFIGEDRGEVNSLVRIVFADQLDAIKSLVLQIALKRPNTVGAPCEFAILRLIEEDGNDEPKKAVTTVFTNIWSDEEVSVETKLQIISGLNDSFTDIRKVAIDSGLCDFVIKTCRRKADQTAPLLVRVLNFLLVT
ncbi:hypothetical protein BJ165DRAFT_272665 [Panaeolus papilionaceus]|nr:hypothetical protein BJ165DRAFT_272665 [Panaeolus papilionaceus]